MKTSFAFGSVIFLVAAITSVVAVQTSAAATAAQDSTAIRPFTVPIVPQAALDDLRRRIAATRWPEKETVADQSQGVQLATMQKLASYWGKDYDWRKCEAETESAAELHHDDRWAGHSFHSRPVEKSQRAADDHHARLARLDRRTIKDHRSADESDGTWRKG